MSSARELKASDVSAEAAANKYIQERFVPKLVAAGIVVCVDIVRRPDDDAPQGAAIVKKADEVDAATIVICPHQQDFSEVTAPAAVPPLDGRVTAAGPAPAQWAAWTTRLQ